MHVGERLGMGESERKEEWGKAEEESERSCGGNHRAYGEGGVVAIVTPACGGRVQGLVG